MGPRRATPAEGPLMFRPRCPDHRDWQAVLDRSATGDEPAGLVGHPESCPECRQVAVSYYERYAVPLLAVRFRDSMPLRRRIVASPAPVAPADISI